MPLPQQSALTALLEKLVKHPQSEPFREAVDWKAWGLMDYPLIVKVPMDLGTVSSKLQADNQDGSEYYKLASKFDKLFDREMAKIMKKAGKGETAKPPTADEKAKFCRNVYSIKAVQMGRMVATIDEMCEQALDKTNPDEIEINIDIIDPVTFRKVDNYVKDCINKEAGKKKTKRKSEGGAAASSGSDLPASKKLKAA